MYGMTLPEWAKAYGHYTAQHANGGWFTHAQPGNKGWPELYNLTDFYVSSVQAGVAWLGRKTAKVIIAEFMADEMQDGHAYAHALIQRLESAGYKITFDKVK